MKKLADAVNQKQTTVVEGHTPVNNNTDLSERIIHFMGTLETMHIRTRELHWASTKMAEHTLLDNIDNEVLGFLDEIAEVTMGITGKRFGIGDLKHDYEFDESHDISGLLSGLEEIVLDLKKDLSDEPSYAGLQSLLDEFVAKINKWNYLKTFA